MEIVKGLPSLNYNLASQSRDALYDLWRGNNKIFNDVFQVDNPFKEAKYSYEILRGYFSSGNLIDDLHRSGIIVKNRTLSHASCRINVLKTGISDSSYPLFICTDPPCLNFTERTYPFIDDAEYWFKAFDKNIVHNPSLIIDLYYDNGAVGIELARHYKNAKVIGLCKNERSLLYAKFNASLNKVENFFAEQWKADISASPGSAAENQGARCRQD